MEIPVPRKKEKVIKEKEKIVEEEKDVKKEKKKESLGLRILNLLFGWPPYAHIFGAFYTTKVIKDEKSKD